MIRILAAFMFLFIACPANAAPLVADLSNYRISMDANFSGTRLFLFGVRNEGGDIVVVVRGPQKNYLVRKKEEFAGIWINRDRMKFFDVPNFYAIASSKPLSDIDRNTLFSGLRIGENHLISAPADPAKIARFNAFEEAFLDYQHAQKLYMSNPEPISFMGETLFKTTVDFPDNIPPGEYTAEIYLISDGEVVGMQSTPISVVKSGLDAFIYNFAHGQPALYGLTAIACALAAGLIAGRLFESRA